MSKGRANSPIWKIVVPDGSTPGERLREICSAYDARVSAEGLQPLERMELSGTISGVELELYVRSGFSRGFAPFVEPYLASPDVNGRKFYIRRADACLFISSEEKLYAVTSGSAYWIIADFVDYGFPFDMAKRLVSNGFSAADVRDLTGSRSSRSETYRGPYPIDRSEALDSVWKKLVGRLSAKLLPAESAVRNLIKGNRLPAIEIKSSLVVRQTLTLAEICTLILALEDLPNPTAEHLRELSFLDNIYPIRSDKDLTDKLRVEFVEQIRRGLMAGEMSDVDVLDPTDHVTYNSGFSFRLGWEPVGDSPPDMDDLVPILSERLSDCVSDKDRFHEEFSSLWLSYRVDPDDEARQVRRRLFDCLHGQVDLSGSTYFRLDKVWYRPMGDFLANLKDDFLAEVFAENGPLLRADEVQFAYWQRGDEDAFNKHQSEKTDFYLGDKVFAKTDRGKIELFDLLKVDPKRKRLYVVHVKKGFSAKMRDACSQLRLAADAISGDVLNGKSMLNGYYSEWYSEGHAGSVTRPVFLSWFDYEVIYVILCSTPNEFIADDFRQHRLTSHIARREIMSIKNEMKVKGREFRLAHTRYTT